MSPRPTNRASRHELGRVARHLQSYLIRALIDSRRQGLARRGREVARRLGGQPHRVHYFHEVADPYGHLAVQALPALARRHAIEIVPHLAGPASWPDIPEPELLRQLARRDCAAVAPHYGLRFPEPTGAPTREDVSAVECALSIAAREGAEVFVSRATALGDALWSGDSAALRATLAELPRDDEAETARRVEAGRRLRSARGHYSGATFLHAGEWYWGVDRLYHLERRLESLGAVRDPDAPTHPRPPIEMLPVARADEMTLEIFPSLRSPYTAIGLEPALEMAHRTGVRHVLRPVLPMVMRGVPASFRKGRYIMADTLREAAAMEMPFGRILDPIGEPVRRALSLWPWARSEGRGEALLTVFLRAAFAEGVDTSTHAGLRSVVERAGLSWDAARAHLGDPAWEEELERNRLAMVEEMGQWGVPSFRLRGPEGAPDLCCWGQDRLWLVSREIQARGGASGGRSLPEAAARI